MFSFFQKKSYQNLNKITLSREALLTNHQNLQSAHPKSAVCPVLKSNAYGHGLKEVAPIFDSMDCHFLVVDSLFEAYELLKLKVKTKILVMGYTASENFKVKKLPFDFAIFDLESAKALNKYQPGCSVHIFIDTGMCREGVSLDDLPDFLAEIKKLKNIKVLGLCSHFADADNPLSLKFTKQQIKTYKKALQILQKFDLHPKWRHISASGGAFKIKDEVFNMLRVGLAHYGISPLEKNDAFQDRIPLAPVLEFSSTLVQIKKIFKGDLVGYGCTFEAKENTIVGLLPAGYYDGVDRRLSSLGQVKIREDFFPIIGRVSMNMTSIDISKLIDPRVGEKVIIYSANEADANSLAKVAAKIKTIPYDILVHLAASIKRIVVR